MVVLLRRADIAPIGPSNRESVRRSEVGWPSSFRAMPSKARRDDEKSGDGEHGGVGEPLQRFGRCDDADEAEEREPAEEDDVGEMGEADQAQQHHAEESDCEPALPAHVLCAPGYAPLSRDREAGIRTSMTRLFQYSSGSSG